MDYAHWDEMPTRWRDNDVYGHLNNVVHYELMDSVINRWLIAEAGSRPRGEPVRSGCASSRAAPTRPRPPTRRRSAWGCGSGKLGTSSVRYELGLFEGERLLAEGEFTHVFVDRVTRRPAPIVRADAGGDGEAGGRVKVRSAVLVESGRSSPYGRSRPLGGPGADARPAGQRGTAGPDRGRRAVPLRPVGDRRVASPAAADGARARGGRGGRRVARRRGSLPATMWC